MLTGAAIVAVTAAILAATALAETRTRPSADGPRDRALAGAEGHVTPDAAAHEGDEHAEGDISDGDFVSIRAVQTTNIYASPSRAAETVAVLPGDRTAEADAQTTDGGWLRVAYPTGSEQRGWLPAAAVQPLVAEDGLADALAALPVVAPALVGGADPPDGDQPGLSAEPAPLVDLAIGDAFVLEDGRLAVGIRNVGAAALVDTQVPLRITAAEGDILGVLLVGPATIEAGGRATVLTPVRVTTAGNYRIAIDASNEISELDESNNTRDVLLLPGNVVSGAGTGVSPDIEATDIEDSDGEPSDGAENKPHSSPTNAEQAAG